MKLEILIVKAIVKLEQHEFLVPQILSFCGYLVLPDKTINLFMQTCLHNSFKKTRQSWS